MDIANKIDNDITTFGKEHYYYKPFFSDKKQDYIYRNKNNLFIDYAKKYTNINTICADLRVLQQIRKVTINGYILPNTSKRELRLLKIYWILQRRLKNEK